MQFLSYCPLINQLFSKRKTLCFIYLWLGKQSSDKLSDQQVAIDDITYFRPAKTVRLKFRTDAAPIVCLAISGSSSAALDGENLHAKKLAGTTIFSTSLGKNSCFSRIQIFKTIRCLSKCLMHNLYNSDDHISSKHTRLYTRIAPHPF